MVPFLKPNCTQIHSGKLHIRIWICRGHSVLIYYKFLLFKNWLKNRIRKFFHSYLLRIKVFWRPKNLFHFIWKSFDKLGKDVTNKWAKNFQVILVLSYQHGTKKKKTRVFTNERTAWLYAMLMLMWKWATAPSHLGLVFWCASSR